MEKLSLIDVSSEDDLLTFSSRHASIEHASSVIVGSVEGGSQVNMNRQMEQALQLPNSPEKNKSKSVKHYSQKSLDWDRDFFTSEGVLDFEELAIMNSTFKKTEACSLSIIPEDGRKSTESNSTLGSDSLALENLEVELFENVRASIRKTPSTGAKASKLAHPSKKNDPVKGGEFHSRSSVKVEPSSQNKKKPTVASERHGVSNQGNQHTSRWATVAAHVGADGIASSKTAPKPTRVLSRATLPTSAKTSSVPGNTQIRTSDSKDKPGNVVPQKSAMVSKKINGSSGIGTSTSKPAQLPKSTLNLISNSSSTAHKSPLETRMRSISGTINRSSSGSSARTSNVVGRNAVLKVVGRNASNVATSPTSTVRLLSSTISPSTISPSSSFDSIASGSSSSTLSAIKSLMDSDEASSSSLSLEGAGNDKVHPPGLKSHLSSEAHGDYLYRVHGIKSSRDDHEISDPSRGNHQKSYTNNSSGAKCKPSVLHKSQPCHFGTSSQNSQHPNFSKATTGISKTTSVSKPKDSQSQHITPATHKAIISGSRQTRSTARSRSRTPSIESLKQLSKLAESNDLTGTTEGTMPQQ